jgi:hypothetical protein
MDKDMVESTRADHIAWLIGIFAIPLGLGAWLGVPGMLIPMFLLSVAWVASLGYVHVMFACPTREKLILDLVFTAFFIGVGWFYWHVFIISLNIQMVNEARRPDGKTEIRLKVELTNSGRPTSLRKWRLTLVDEHGRAYFGRPLTLVGDRIEMFSEHGGSTIYALPDCDLYAETVRAMQSGDSAYGIADFLFPDLPFDRELLKGSKITLQVEDMLDRPISIKGAPVSQIETQPTEVFPCKTITQP